MIKILQYSEINFDKYKSCIENCVQNSDFARRNFLDIVTDNNFFLLSYNGYDSVMPVHYKLKFGFRFIFMPRLCQQLGVFSKKDDPEINELFYEFLNENFLVANYTFNGDNNFTNQKAKKTSYLIKKNIYETVKKNYSVNRRRNVRISEALSNDIVFRNEKSNDAEAFFTDNVKGLKNKGDVEAFFRIFQNLFKQKIGHLNILEFKNEIQSFVYLYEGKNNYYLSLFVNNFPIINPNFPSIMVDYCLKNFIEFKNFDFVGSDIENIAKFNLRFGAVKYQYSIITNSNFTLLKKLLTGYKIISNFAP